MRIRPDMKIFTYIISLLVLIFICVALSRDRDASKWIRATAGNADAQYSLGIKYGSSIGGTKDYKKAAIWYRKAAEQGFPQAQYAMGNMYADGKGVPQNYLLAHVWFNRCAAIAVDEEIKEKAKVNRELMARRMNSIQLAEAQRLASE